MWYMVIKDFLGERIGKFRRMRILLVLGGFIFVNVEKLEFIEKRIIYGYGYLGIWIIRDNYYKG